MKIRIEADENGFESFQPQAGMSAKDTLAYIERIGLREGLQTLYCTRPTYIQHLCNLQWERGFDLELIHVAADDTETVFPVVNGRFDYDNWPDGLFELSVVVAQKTLDLMYGS